jgi:hypothetical protein
MHWWEYWGNFTGSYSKMGADILRVKERVRYAFMYAAIFL